MFFRLFPPFFLLFCLTGCTQVATTPAAAPAGKPAAETPSRPFPPDTLYALLVAEFAGARGETDLALKNYSEQAQQTRDAGIAQRATEIAEATGASQLALDNAALWRELDPHSSEPDAVVANEMLRQNKLVEAFDASALLLDKGYQPQFQALAARAARSNASVQQPLLDRFSKTLATHPDNASLLLGKALLHELLGKHDDAERWCRKAMSADPASSAAFLLMASLLESKGKVRDAVDVLHQRMQRDPYDSRVHLQYARALAALDRPSAQQEYHQIADRNPFDADILLALALLCQETGDKEQARHYYEQVLFLQKHQSNAYFHLGQIAESDGDSTKALELYRRVSDSDDYFPAIVAFCQLALRDNLPGQCHQHFDEERARTPEFAGRLFLLEAALLEEQKQPAKSLSILNAALASFPDDIDLLYSRSMTQDQLGHLAESEADLHRILDLDHDNANALNALGYELITRTDRYPEAYDYISRALALEPGNAAIIDSMGWVLYRLHRTDEALGYLGKAMSLLPNHEIAAHFGEVLWVSGKQDEARSVWKKGLEDKPDSDVIHETLERLQVK